MQGTGVYIVGVRIMSFEKLIRIDWIIDLLWWVCSHDIRLTFILRDTIYFRLTLRLLMHTAAKTFGNCCTKNVLYQCEEGGDGRMYIIN
jgi:hypothetical protein